MYFSRRRIKEKTFDMGDQMKKTFSKGEALPSSKLSLAKDCPLRTVTERNAAELDLPPPRYLEA